MRVVHRAVWTVSSVCAVVVALVGAAGCSPGDRRSASPVEGTGTQLFYDASGRLAAVGQEEITAVYRFDAAGNRVAVDHVESGDFEPDTLRPPSEPGPKVSAVSPALVRQGATVIVTGRGFDPDPIGNVVAVGGALGRVLSATTGRLQVQLPPVATPGPVTVSTAAGRTTGEDDVVVTPAEVRPTEVDHVVATDLAEAVALDAGTTLVTFRGKAGATVELRLDVGQSGSQGCDAGEVGLAGPTGTIIEARAGDESWCGRPAELPMTGTYTATVTVTGGVRATVRERAGVEEAARLPGRAVAATAARTSESPPIDGPPDFPVDLATGQMDSAVTDLALGGSGAVDLARTFSVGDADLPALAPEEPLARHWSLAGSIALEPSMSFSFLDLVMPDGRRLPFQRVTQGAPEPAGAVFEPSGGVGAGPFAGARVVDTGAGWELRTRAGSVLGFGRTGSPLRLAWIRDPGGLVARFIRAPDDTDGSPDGDLVGVVSESGQWARLEHDSQHRITAATDQVGDRVSYRYDRPDGVFADVLTRVTYRRAGGPVTRVGHRYQVLTGRLLAVTDGRRDRVRFDYDDAGRVVRQRVLRPAAGGGSAGEWRYSYDVGQRRVAIPGRPGSIRLPQVNRVVVDGPGGRRTVSYRNSRWTSGPATRGSGRGAGSRLVPSLLKGPGGVAAGYVSSGGAAAFVDARGRLAGRRTPEGALSRIGYDAFDRPTSITEPAGTTQLTYTRAGDLASVSDAAGTTGYAWDRAGRQVAERDPLGGRQRWRYGRAGRLVRHQDARGVVSTFGYDSAGRLTVAAYGVQPGHAPESRVRYGYDRAGRLVKVRDSAAGSASLRYDADGNLVGETTGSGTVAASYDGDGNRTSMALPGGVSEEYDYDKDGRPVRLSLRGASGEARVVPTYDVDGRLNALDLPHDVRGRFSYEDDEVVGLSYTRDGHELVDQRAGHDPAGRVDHLEGDLGRMVLPAVESEAGFDAAHQLVGQGGRGWRHDRAGNLLADATHRYTWDARGRLVAVDGPEGPTVYGYDALGRRVSATTGGRRIGFVYDGDDVVQRVAADGSRTTYLRGPDGTPLASTSSGHQGTTALLPDLFGNVGAAVTADGTSRFGYDPFGVRGATDEAGGDVPGFRGLLSDATGQLSMGARVYDPSTGRFLSRDSWGIQGGDPNPYRYALGAPTVYTDPSGHAAECVGIALGWAMSVLGPGGGWDDYDALQEQVGSGRLTEDQWAVKQDRLAHDLWAGFDVVANVCGTSAVGTSAAALPLLGAGKVTSRVLGSLADDAVTGAAATRIGNGFGRVAPGVSARAREVLETLARDPGCVPTKRSWSTSRSSDRRHTCSGRNRYGGEPGNSWFPRSWSDDRRSCTS